MTPEELAELRRACEEATPGPWMTYDEKPYSQLVNPCGWDEHDAGCPGQRYWSTGPDCKDRDCAEADMRFIAAARTALPRLLDEVERLRLVNGLHEERREHDERQIAKLEAENAELRAALEEQRLCWALLGHR